MSPPPAAQTAGAALIAVETLIQAGPVPASTGAAEAPAGIAAQPLPLARQGHRVPAGTSIRALLFRVGLHHVVAQIESGTLGLACHGRRAWLDDVLTDGARVEVVAPINVDAKAARVERVVLDRIRRRSRPA